MLKLAREDNKLNEELTSKHLTPRRLALLDSVTPVQIMNEDFEAQSVSADFDKVYKKTSICFLLLFPLFPLQTHEKICIL